MFFDESPRGIDNPIELFEQPASNSRGPGKGTCSDPLGGEELARYQRNGFLCFRNLFAGSVILKELMAELLAFKQNDSVVRSPNGVVDPQTGILCSILDVDKISEKFKNLTRDPLILGMVRQLLGSEVYLRQSRINDEDAYVGSGFSWDTEDEPWSPSEPDAGYRSIGVSLTLSDNSEFNGPLTQSPVPHYYVEAENAQASDQRDSSEPEEGNMSNGGAGTLLLYECSSFQLATKNVSPWPQANALLVYNSISAPMRTGYGKGTRAGRIRYSRLAGAPTTEHSARLA